MIWQGSTLDRSLAAEEQPTITAVGGWGGRAAHPEILEITNFNTVICTVAMLQCSATQFSFVVAHPKHAL
jgi:hypothetical protein